MGAPSGRQPLRLGSKTDAAGVRRDRCLELRLPASRRKTYSTWSNTRMPLPRTGTKMWCDRAVGKILPGAEAASRAGQEQHPKRRVGTHAREGVADLRVHRVIEAVQAIRTVEREASDAGLARKDDALVCHRHAVLLSSLDHTCIRCCTTRNRLATNAASVSAAFAAGLAPVPW